MQRSELAPNTIFDGKYRVNRLMGEGGFGRVYDTFDIKLERPVALKVLRPETSTPIVIDRFLREVKLAKRIEHANVVRVYDYGECDEMLYMAMELVKGQELRDVLHFEHTLPPARAVRITLQILDALAEAHSHGVIHRDMKPENILLTEEGVRTDVVKVLDFGIAKAVNATVTQQNLTEDGVSCGTPLYMAPEQFRATEIGPHTDIYAVGLVLVEMLTGSVPIEGENVYEIVAAHLQHGAKLTPELESSVFGPLLRRALQKEPEARFASAAEMWKAVRNAGRALQSSDLFEFAADELTSRDFNLPKDFGDSSFPGFNDSSMGSSLGKHQAITEGEIPQQPDTHSEVDSFFDDLPETKPQAQTSLASETSGPEEEWWQDAVSNALSKPVSIAALEAAVPDPDKTPSPEQAPTRQPTPQGPPPSSSAPPVNLVEPKSPQLIGPKPVESNHVVPFLIVVLLVSIGIAAFFIYRTQLAPQSAGNEENSPTQDESGEPAQSDPLSFQLEPLKKACTQGSLSWLPLHPLSFEIVLEYTPTTARVKLDGQRVCSKSPCKVRYIISNPGLVEVSRRGFAPRTLNLGLYKYPLNEPLKVELERK